MSILGEEEAICSLLDGSGIGETGCRSVSSSQRRMGENAMGVIRVDGVGVIHSVCWRKRGKQKDWALSW